MVPRYLIRVLGTFKVIKGVLKSCAISAPLTRCSNEQITPKGVENPSALLGYFCEVNLSLLGKYRWVVTQAPEGLPEVAS